MKYLINFIGVFFLLFSISCSNDKTETTSLVNEDENLVLESPNGMILEESTNILAEKITGKSKGVNITKIRYLDLPKNKNGLVAFIDYKVDEDERTIMILRNIFNLKFEKGTVLQFSSENKSKSISQTNNDIYISCDGSDCCYPSGTYNPDSGNVVTSCKCEGNPSGNSGCVMRISETDPTLEG